MQNQRTCDSPGAKTHYIFIKAGMMQKAGTTVIDSLFEDKTQVEKAVVSCSPAKIFDLIKENFDLEQ